MACPGHPRGSPPWPTLLVPPGQGSAAADRTLGNEAGPLAALGQEPPSSGQRRAGERATGHAWAPCPPRAAADRASTLAWALQGGLPAAGPALSTSHLNPVQGEGNPTPAVTPSPRPSTHRAALALGGRSAWRLRSGCSSGQPGLAPAQWVQLPADPGWRLRSAPPLHQQTQIPPNGPLSSCPSHRLRMSWVATKCSALWPV